MYELKYVEPIPPNDYRVVGYDRSVNALLVGLYPEQVTSDWAYVGRLITNQDNTVWIGDSMLDIVSDYQLEKLRIFNETFFISGVCLDPLNKGYTVYASYEYLTDKLNVDASNILLIETNTITATLQQQVTEYGLTMVDLTALITTYSKYFQQLRSTLLIIPLLLTISLTITLWSYVSTTFLGMQPDYAAMRAIGLKWSQMKKILIIKGSLLILPWFLLGTILGIYISYNILIPFPQFPPESTVLYNVLWLGFISFVLVLGSSFMSLKLLNPVFSKRS